MIIQNWTFSNIPLLKDLLYFGGMREPFSIAGNGDNFDMVVPFLCEAIIKILHFLFIKVPNLCLVLMVAIKT